MKPKPLVSVIIPTYNHALYIVKAIESVLKQNYQPIEIVVVNDGSTDNTKEILSPYLSKIKYIYQSNNGLSAARNTGIKNATGEYIALLDADDKWLPKKLTKQMGLFLKNPKLDLVYSDIYQSFDGKIHPLTYWQRNKIKPCLGGQNCLIQLFKVNFIPGGISAMFKKNMTNKIGLFNENLKAAEDYDYWLRAVSKGVVINYINEPLAIYRMHEAQMSTNIERMLEANMFVLKKAIQQNMEYFKDKHWIIRYRFFYLFGSSAYYHLKHGNLIMAIKNTVKAIKNLLNLNII